MNARRGASRGGRRGLAFAVVAAIACGACRPLEPERTTRAAPFDEAGTNPPAIANDEPASARDHRREPSQRFAIVATKRDREFGLAEDPYNVPFGPSDGAVATYDTPLLEPDGSRRLEWWGHADTMEVVFGTEHLRRVTLRAGAIVPIDLHYAVLSGDPELEEGSQSRIGDDIVWTPFVERVAPRVVFEETEESFCWDEIRGSVFGRGPRKLRGRIVTADGTPPGRFVVRVGEHLMRATTRPDGSYVVGNLSPGEVHVVANDFDGGEAIATVVIGDEDANLDLQLQPGPSLRGRVVDSRSLPVADALVLWWTASGALRTATTDGDGRYVVPRITAEPGQAWVCVPDATRSLNTELPAVGRAVTPGEADFVLDERVCAGSLRIPVAVPDGLDLASISARMWQQASGIGVRLVRANAPNGELVFGRDRLPVGDYRIELYCPGLGRIDVGFVRIDGTTRTTLRGLTLPAPARVSFTMDRSRAEPAKGTFALVRRGVAVDHRLATKQSFEGPHRLGAGDYGVFWSDGANVNHHAFTIDASAAGSDVVIDLR